MVEGDTGALHFLYEKHVLIRSRNLSRLESRRLAGHLIVFHGCASHNKPTSLKRGFKQPSYIVLMYRITFDNVLLG